MKEKIAEISPGLPEKVLDDGTVSRLTVVPFYDRTQLIRETLGTLDVLINNAGICVYGPVEKTPLANIREGSELLREGVVGPMTREQTEVAELLHNVLGASPAVPHHAVGH